MNVLIIIGLVLAGGAIAFYVSSRSQIIKNNAFTPRPLDTANKRGPCSCCQRSPCEADDAGAAATRIPPSP